MPAVPEEHRLPGLPEYAGGAAILEVRDELLGDSSCTPQPGGG